MKKLNITSIPAENAEGRNTIPAPGIAECTENKAEATAIAPASDAAEGVETPNAPSLISEAGLGDNHLAGKRVDMVKPDDLKPNVDSTKVYGEEVCPALETSIADEEIQNPLIVDRASGTVIDGNSRLKVATKLGIPFVPVIYVDGGYDPLAMVASNVARAKTLEVKVREFIIYENQEKREAKTRRKSKIPTVGPKKSRDRAAAKVGLSASSLEMGREVVRALDGLEAKKDPDRANQLRAKLNKDGIKPAHELAISLGVIKSKARSKADEAPKQKKEMRSDTETGEVDAKDSEEWDHNAQAENHVRALQALTTFCQEGEASELDAATKERLGEAFAAASQAMTDAGIFVPTSLN